MSRSVPGLIPLNPALDPKPFFDLDAGIVVRSVARFMSGQVLVLVSVVVVGYDTVGACRS